MTPESEYQKIREEIRAEHALIANRLTWYVTSQSFLVSAFAISCGSGFTWHRWFPTLLLPLIALTISIIIYPSILGARKTIQLWREKQCEFFTRHPDLGAAFDLKRPVWVSSQAMVFPAVVPLLFSAFWIIIILAS